MTPKEKAEELVEMFKDYVHGYVCSSMLRNHEYPEQILSKAIQCALIAVDEIINASSKHQSARIYSFYTQVKTELKNMKP